MNIEPYCQLGLLLIVVDSMHAVTRCNASFRRLDDLWS